MFQVVLLEGGPLNQVSLFLNPPTGFLILLNF